MSDLTVGGEVVVGLLVDDEVNKVTWRDETTESVLCDGSNNEHVLRQQHYYHHHRHHRHHRRHYHNLCFSDFPDHGDSVFEKTCATTQKKRKKSCFLKSEKNVCVFSNTAVTFSAHTEV